MSKTYRKVLKFGICTSTNTEYYRSKRKAQRKQLAHELHTAMQYIMPGAENYPDITVVWIWDHEGYKKMFYEDFNNGSDTISCVRSWGYLDYDEPIAMKWLDHYCDFNKYAMTTKVTYNGKVIFEGKLE